MDLEIKKLAEKWEYIQGGLLFIDETEDKTRNCLDTADGELRYYINKLSSIQQKASELIDALKLTVPSRSFEEIPESFLILLEQDITYLAEDPAVMDESYGSLAMVAFYKHVSDYLNIPSEIPGAMQKKLEQRMHEALPKIKVSW